MIPRSYLTCNFHHEPDRQGCSEVCRPVLEDGDFGKCRRPSLLSIDEYTRSTFQHV